MTLGRINPKTKSTSRVSRSSERSQFCPGPSGSTTCVSHAAAATCAASERADPAPALQLARLERFGGGAVQHLTPGVEARAMARTIPAAFERVPRHLTALVRAHRADGVQRPCVVAVD